MNIESTSATGNENWPNTARNSYTMWVYSLFGPTTPTDFINHYPRLLPPPLTSKMASLVFLGALFPSASTFSESLLFSSRRMASLTSSFSTVSTSRSRASAVESRRMASRFLAEVNVMSLLLRASRRSSTYAPGRETGGGGDVRVVGFKRWGSAYQTGLFDVRFHRLQRSPMRQ